MDYIKLHKLHLIILLILLSIISFVSFFTLDYSLVAPGYNNNVADFIVIDDGIEESGSFHTTSVVVVRKTSLLQYIAAQFEDRVNVSANPEYYNDVTNEDLDYRRLAMKDDSLATSLVVAALNAGINVTYESFLTIYMTYNYLEKDTIELGDKIISINGGNPNDMLATFDCGDVATFEVLRGNDTFTYDILKKEVNGYCAFGLYAKQYTEISDIDINYEFVQTNTGGPSGGLLQTLYIYNELTTTDYTYGLKIAGTGTIDVLGNVGPIGGIEQKIITSAMNQIDIFFVPHLSDSENDNYIVAARILETLNSDMILVPVETFDDALTYLQEMGGF